MPKKTSTITPQTKPVEINDDPQETAKAAADIEPIDRLDRVRALKEVAADVETAQMQGGIEYFKDADGRTMRVCVADGELCKQEVRQAEVMVP